jgi:hypothetical protein
VNTLFSRLLVWFSSPRVYGRVVLLLAVLLVSHLYDYERIVKLRPQSIHVWRQTDCTSLAYNYYKKDFNFFHPQIHNHQGDNWESGAAVGEAPIFYYFIASIYKVFGFKEVVHRALNLIVFYLGLLALYEVCFLLLANVFWSVCIPILLFTSTVIAFYANNFLIDPVALSFCFWGYYFFFRTRSGNSTGYGLAALFFTIAGLLKITVFISGIAVALFIVIEGWRAFGFKRMFKENLRNYLPFVFSFATIAAWYVFAKK